VDSLRYISVEGMHRATAENPDKFCDACFTGNYPVALTDDEQIVQLTEPDKTWARAELERVMRSLD
jgi:glutamine phosphoribosylpyrophosphate amidotransferase